MAETDEELVAYLAGLGGTSAGVLNDPELLELMLPALGADLRAVATAMYPPRPPLRLPIHAFSGAADPTTARPALMAAWRQETTGTFQQTVYAGGHFFITHLLGEVTVAVSRDLEDLLARRRGAAHGG